MDGDREAGEKPRRTSTLKNVLIVAAILGVLVILTLAGGLVWMVRIARESVATRQQALIATNTDFPFTPPADGRMSEEQFQSWMRVARQLEDLRQAHAAELGGSGKQPSLGEYCHVQPERHVGPGRRNRLGLARVRHVAR